MSFFKEVDAIFVSINRGTSSNDLIHSSNLFTNMEPTQDALTGGTMPSFHLFLIKCAAE